ncbi:MAG TPA: hypothetical protein VGY66_13550 [Gemmataceae bacterium]|jgi:hypothetical protein|nr:hypothetical protein [Gemmataceae bacterium]
MITGVVKADEGRIRLKVKGPHGREQEIEAVIDDPDPLVGMRLLRGHELKMQVRARGKVTIERLP